MQTYSRKSGFTLIEVMITITLFSALMIIGTGAVLKTNAVYKKTQTMRSVMDNLSFIMEDMSRNLRLGSNYHCFSGGESYVQSAGTTSQDCSLETGALAISFVPVTPDPNVSANNQFVYAIEQGNDSKYIIKKSKDGGINFTQLTPVEVEIDPAQSGFAVFGSTVGLDQPRVMIRLSGKVIYKDAATNFNLQTTVSQRGLDI